ncbi:MAG: HlyD family efflux transporter periplasmic adaptor subunit, partial [Gammaproteobacteria bacterium]|nr:HlyD family efflux transporter periplasmic adaptor subunit [Gammaproteobacteria bacterium]
MRNSLFRREVTASQHDHFFGDPVFHQPMSLQVLLLMAVGLFCVIAVFAANANIRQTENVRGFIYTTNGEVKVYANRSGVIDQLHIRNGQLVSRGQTLVSLINPAYNQAGVEAEKTSVDHIEQQITQIEQRLGLSVERQQLAFEQAQSRQVALHEELQLRDDDFHLTVQQLEMADDEYARLELLRTTGAISASELAQGKNALITVRKAVQAVRLSQQTTKRLWQD